MSQKSVVIKISADGHKVEIEAKGFSGSGCLKATEGFERALLGDDAERDLKSEYYETEETAQVAEETEFEG